MKKNGRPTKYDYEKMHEIIETYLSECIDEEKEFHKMRGEKSDSYERYVRVRIPTIEGLCLKLEINKGTLYEWIKIYPMFSNDFDKVQELQANRLIENGLSGTYNSTIAKLLLSKHSYREASEQEIKSDLKITFDESFNQ